MAYCGVTKWEHINQFGHVHTDILSNVRAVSWIWDKTKHAPITHTHHPRWRDKDRQGQKVFFLVNLGCDYRVWRRQNLSMKSILRSSECQQQQFSPSELIGPSVAALCCWTKPIGEDKRGKRNEKNLQGADMESKKQDYFVTVGGSDIIRQLRDSEHKSEEPFSKSLCCYLCRWSCGFQPDPSHITVCRPLSLLLCIEEEMS